MLRRRSARAARIEGFVVGPSTPKLSDQFALCPSRLSSPLAWLCRSTKDTTSDSVNPSWAVSMLTDAVAGRPEWSNCSAEPVSRSAMTGT